jgi:formyl-CoA transferase
VRWADVLVTNFPPKVRARLGLEYEALAPLNSRLIYADVTGFGETGPDADLPGFDVTAYWARSGMMDFTRQSGAPPAISFFGAGDHPTAIMLFAGIMTAFTGARRPARGTGHCVTGRRRACGSRPCWSAGRTCAR